MNTQTPNYFLASELSLFTISRLRLKHQTVSTPFHRCLHRRREQTELVPPMLSIEFSIFVRLEGINVGSQGTEWTMVSSVVWCGCECDVQ